MVNILKIVAVVIGALIGAGFASGQEIYVFFYSYGTNGILGLLLCSIMISFIVYKVLKTIKINNINTYKEYVNFIIKNNTKRKYFNLGFIINTIVNIFLLITFYIMIAGFGAYFSQELNLSRYIGSAILVIMCFISLMRNANGVIKINTFLIPILIIFIMTIGITNISNINIIEAIQNNVQTSHGNWVLSSLLYASYNSILLIPVLMTLKKVLKNKKDITIASIIVGTVILGISIVLYFIIVRVDIDISTLEMPVVYAISKYFSSFKVIYAFIILASIYTTAISLSVSLLENITKNKKTYTQIALVMCITSLLISGFGFSNLINLLYPIFGYLGLVQILALVIKKNT